MINHNPIPVIIDSNVFEGMDISACTLYVPYGSKEAYQNTAVWCEFYIEELSSLGVAETERDTALPSVAGYYSITGQRLLQEPQKGIYIVVYENGTTEKRVK